MRISTAMIFDRGTSMLNSMQDRMLNTQQQLASGLRVQKPSDDPVASARVVEVSQASAINTQYAANQKSAQSALEMVESRLGAIGDVISQALATMVAAGNGAYNDSDLRALSTELRGRFSEIMGLANSVDGEGNYLFAGYRSDITPFTGTPESGVSYHGDQGQRAMKVDGGRVLGTTESGSAVFMEVPSGNGTFVTAATAGNTGTGSISIGTVTGPVSLNGTVTMTFDAPNNQFLVAGATPAVAPIAYAAGQPVEFNGMSFTLGGAPANGDSFTIDAAGSDSLFAALGSAIQALENPGSTGAERATAKAAMMRSANGLDNSLDSVLRVRASVGVRLAELETLGIASEDLNLQYQKSLSDLRDLDYASAISEYMMQQTALQASQMSFQKITSLSLFNYL